MYCILNVCCGNATLHRFSISWWVHYQYPLQVQNRYNPLYLEVPVLVQTRSSLRFASRYRFTFPNNPHLFFYVYYQGIFVEKNIFYPTIIVPFKVSVTLQPIRYSVWLEMSPSFNLKRMSLPQIYLPLNGDPTWKLHLNHLFRQHQVSCRGFHTTKNCCR